MTFEAYLILIAKFGAAMGALALIWKYLKPILEYTKSFLLMPEMVKKIELETKTNGGATIKDALNRIERRQLVQEQRTAFLLEINPDIGTFETDPHGNIIRSNSLFNTISGKSQDELQGNSWINNISNEDRDRVYNEFFLASNQKRMFSSVFFVRKGTSVLEMECRMSPVLDKNNEIITWIASLKRASSF